MDQYSRIFRFLLRLRRAALALRALWSHLRELPLGGGDGGGGRRTRARWRPTRRRTRCGCTCTTSPPLRHRGALRRWGVPATAGTAAERVAAAGSAAELRAAHNDYLAGAARCFLHPAGAPTAAVVSAVFGVVAALHRDVAAAGVARVARHVEGALPPADARAGDERARAGERRVGEPVL